MNNYPDLDRFLNAQYRDYATAFTEIKSGHKKGHWMWYIFPQVDGLGFSNMAKYYAIKGLPEAKAFLAHPILGPRLVAISKALLTRKGDNVREIMGAPDDLKLRSSMTLFAFVPGADLVFKAVLEKYYLGEKDQATVQFI
ncbi:DUF1810 domain-containing protein [Mucilaginibacter gynuensis]|uniref:DUF1810 domain-containing protein n=1 Tax=Mucilaginibacter gynuensis TaxID=1302236 RepID=A0ABP8GLZ3_9SPHI